MYGVGEASVPGYEVGSTYILAHLNFTLTKTIVGGSFGVSLGRTIMGKIKGIYCIEVLLLKVDK